MCGFRFIKRALYFEVVREILTRKVEFEPSWEKEDTPEGLKSVSSELIQE